MAEPTLKVEVAFDSSPLDPAPVWTDITDLTQGIDSKMGRNSELDQIDTGTVTLTLDNHSGSFTPRVDGSGVYNIKPRRLARVTATFNGTTYPIAYGIIERWPYALDNSDTVSVEIVDISKMLNDINFGNSDTAMIARLKPVDYFPMQESEAPLFSMTSKRTLNPAWDGAQAREKAQDDNPLPVITYGADSNLPSGNGSSVDLGEFWAEQ